MPKSTALDQHRAATLAEALEVAPIADQTRPEGQVKVAQGSDPTLRAVKNARRVHTSYKVRSGSLDNLRIVRAQLEPNTKATEPNKKKAPTEEPATTTLVEQAHAQARVEILDRWDGVVLDVGDKTFRARLLTEDGGRPQADVEIFTSEVPPGDRHLLKKGSIFFWHVGYRDPQGDRERVSRIRFRSLPTKTKADLRRAQRRAGEIRRNLGWR